MNATNMNAARTSRARLKFTAAAPSTAIATAEGGAAVTSKERIRIRAAGGEQDIVDMLKNRICIAYSTTGINDEHDAATPAQRISG